jgi:hypothetical protein
MGKNCFFAQDGNRESREGTRIRGGGGEMETEQRKLPGSGGGKLAMLKTHKKGMMQQLFPDLQETVPPRPASGRGAGGEGMK